MKYATATALHFVTCGIVSENLT